MVQFIPAKNTWSEIGEKFAGGATEGYMGRADENALRKAVMDLGENASPRDVLNAITNTKTHSKEAKQNVLKNWMGVAEFEQVERKIKAERDIKKDKDAADEAHRNTVSQETQRHNYATEAKQDRALDIQEKKIEKTNKDAKRATEIKSGLQTLQEMVDIGKKGNLGIGTGLRKVYSDEARKDAGQYERLGKSLIQLSTTIPIRNRQEFEVLAHDLYDPSQSDATREGVLTAMKNILSRSLIEIEGEAVQDAGSLVETKAPQGDSKVTEGKVRVRDKKTGKTGSVTPYEGMESKYERIR